MSRWTPDHSALLSLLLDEVVGTKEMIEFRQDNCMLLDCHGANSKAGSDGYFTGSKSEGLDLPGSDMDFMHDINNTLGIKVIQSLQDSPATCPYSVFYMCTENTPPAFALLRYIKPGTSPLPSLCLIVNNMQTMNGLQYLSSNLAVNVFHCPPLHKHLVGRHFVKRERQGPSVEHWSVFENTAESGTDYVMSIHCPFWPNDAIEWIQRPRHFGWPKPQDVSTIVNFGFHLVPVGHPHSRKKSLEWRLSFSLAERTLVWSFNHTQIQCYALMKIILKEFVKKKCSPQNQVLCSYFIKTFLFWQYETNDLDFWQINNLRGCFMYLLTEFVSSLSDGVIRHYFIPRFNLLSVKLTPEAKTELLQLFDSIIQSDISILRECTILKDVWAKFFIG